MEKKYKVLVIATSKKARGGIVSVVKAHETGEHWKKYQCKWIETHRDGYAMRKIGYFFKALAVYVCLIPFYDLVHIHFSTPVSARRKYLFYKIAVLLDKKIVIHLHCGNQLDDIWSPLYYKMFTHADACLVLSEIIKEKVESYTGHLKNIHVLYNPCMLPVNAVRREKKQYILFAGMLIPDKGYADLIKAYAKITPLHKDWKIVFAGNGEIEQGKALAKKLGLENQVVFLGWINGESKDKAFKEASIFCLPSYAEGFPMAVLDAWAHGLPVITTPVGGIPDIAEDGTNMLLFTPGNIDELANQLEKMISNQELRQSIATESLKLAETIFNINTISKQLDNIYSNVL